LLGLKLAKNVIEITVRHTCPLLSNKVWLIRFSKVEGLLPRALNFKCCER
jgi:hypothetical protein